MEGSIFKNIYLELKNNLMGTFKKCYLISATPTKSITFDPTELRTHQGNGTTNGSPIRDMQYHDHIK